MNSLEKILRFGSQFQSQAANNISTLFGDMIMDTVVPPHIPDCEPWSLIDKLRHEKEVTGMFLSGHPLDNYSFEYKNYGIVPIKLVNEYKEELIANGGESKIFKIAALVTQEQHRMSKKGNRFGIFYIEDYSSNLEFSLFSEEYARYSPLLKPGMMVYIKGSFKLRFDGDQLQFKVHEILLLESLMKTHTKKVNVNIHASDVSEKEIDFFFQNLKVNPGSSSLMFTIHEPQRKLKVPLELKTGFQMNNDLAQFLSKHPGWNIKVETN